MSRRSRMTTAVVVLMLATSACAGGDRARDGRAEEGTAVRLSVLAAASLTDAFTELGAAFEVAHPATSVVLDFGASSSLRRRILDGAPADVFASADTSDMDALVSAGVAVDPVPFASNRLQVVVPAGNPAGVRRLADFARPELLLGTCAEEVPCGRLARRSLARSGTVPVLDTEEPDVRSLLTKVEAGELDAGIVYVSDVLAAGATVEGIEIPAEHNVTATYPVALLAEAAHPAEAAALIDFVVSQEGRRILAAYGFAGP